MNNNNVILFTLSCFILSVIHRYVLFLSIRDEIRKAGSAGTAWQPIATAPRDRDILVYAPPYLGLPYIVSNCRWHPDAGFCVDELRQPTMWRDFPEPPIEPGETS